MAQNVNLTTGTDTITFGPGATDTVEGLTDTTPGSTDSTYTAGDTVRGKGLTVVDIAAEGDASGTAALANLSRIASVNFDLATTDTLTVPAAEWPDVKAVDVTGLAGGVDIQHLGNDSAKAVTASHGNFIVNGAKSGSAGSIKVGNINLNAGTAQTLDFHVTQDAPENGDITVGNVTVNAGVKAQVSLSVANHASASNADVRDGNVTVGNVSMHAAASAFILAHIGNYATVRSGNATVGNVTVGNVSLQGLQGVVTLYISNDAYLGQYLGTNAGNVAAGNMTVGNISVHGSAFVAGFNQVDTDGVGSATIGNINVGNIAAVANQKSGGAFFIDLARAVEKGNATAGNLTIGNVSLTGTGAALAYASMYLQGFAVGTGGNAAVGNIGSGNVTLTHNAGADPGGREFFELSNNVIADNGNATAGNVTVGNISINPGGASGVGQTGVEVGSSSITLSKPGMGGWPQPAISRLAT